MPRSGIGAGMSGWKAAFLWISTACAGLSRSGASIAPDVLAHFPGDRPSWFLLIAWRPTSTSSASRIGLWDESALRRAGTNSVPMGRSPFWAEFVVDGWLCCTGSLRPYRLNRAGSNFGSFSDAPRPGSSFKATGLFKPSIFSVLRWHGTPIRLATA